MILCQYITEVKKNLYKKNKKAVHFFEKWCSFGAFSDFSNETF